MIKITIKNMKNYKDKPTRKYITELLAPRGWNKMGKQTIPGMISFVHPEEEKEGWRINYYSETGTLTVKKAYCGIPQRAETLKKSTIYSVEEFLNENL